MACVVSLGTGKVADRRMDTVDLGLPNSTADVVRSVFAANNLKNILIDQVTILILFLLRLSLGRVRVGDAFVERSVGFVMYR